ncbi:TetR/AcrR family transcriptional regulator [Streptomyces uncialis]|uniref:TetR/AcrR family transcriptional regulator n=1 Tax=Streptomyces uncialis TaxID=1048205 RepID=UPI003812182E
MPRRPRKQPNGSSAKGGATRAGILEHAARLFAEKGFAGTSFQDISDAVGLTRPAVYHYFSSKEQVLATLVEETSVSSADTLKTVRLREDLDASAKLRSATAELVRDRANAPERFRMLDRTESALPAELATLHLQARREVLAEMTALITDGIVAGEFRETDERLAALSVLGMANWVAWWYRPSSSETVEDVARTLAESAVAMIARPDHRVPAEPTVHGAIEQVRQDLDYLSRLLVKDE